MRLSIVCACIASALVVVTPGIAQQPSTTAPGGSWGRPAPPAPSGALPTLPPSSASVTITAESNTAPASPAPRAEAPIDAPQPAPRAPAPTEAPVPDRATAPPTGDRLVDQKFLHGFRLGYGYIANYDKPVDALDGKSLKDRVDMKTPHHFLIGYEGMARMVGHSWLNVILVGNVMLAGLEQSRFYPTGNALIGFEIDNSFQFGVGTSLTPLKGQEAHAIVAAGWTPRVGSFYVPLHAFFIPDVDGLHRTGVTTGVTW